MNAMRGWQMRRFPAGLMIVMGFVLALCLFLARRPSPLSAQTLHYAKPPDVSDGEKIYKGGCIACHGADGKGAPEASTVFARPDTFPDFTDCLGTTPEPNGNWKAVIVHGGPSRGFSQIMPAFGDLLTDQQINDVIEYMRGFCNKPQYPRGELNLPRALVTEKAFPEKELVISGAVNARGAPGFTMDVIHEQTFGARSQIEVDVPVNHQVINGQSQNGVGDVTLGVKREMFSSLRTGSILSLFGGVLLPTGDSRRGFGAGTTQFEPFVAFDQLFKENTFLQFQAGADLPVDTSIAPRNLFYRVAVGQALAPDHGLGRLFSPMTEFLASRDFETGASTDWDIVPQMQVTVSRRQHIRVNVGYRTPINNRADRTPQVMFYVLWDWADGKFWDGWR